MENFLRYVDEGFFDGTIFHRIVPGFVIQGGGLTSDMSQKKTHPPVKNEAGNGVRNQRGTLSMARTDEIHSATSQFFVNLADNDFLDQRPGQYGYAVFGQVTEGMDVIDKIAAVPTGDARVTATCRLEDVLITSARRLGQRQVGMPRKAMARPRRGRLWRLGTGAVVRHCWSCC